MKHTTAPTARPRRVSLRQVAAASLLALASLSGHAQLDPKASRFYEDALTRYEKKDFAGAVVQLKNALKVDNKNISAQVLLGKALASTGDVVAAEVAFNEAMRLGVNRAEVVLPLARVVINQGRQQELLDNARFATAGLPPQVQSQLLLLRAGAGADIGDTRTGIKAIEEARQLDPSSPDSYNAEVPIRIRMRQAREATLAADKAVSLGPQIAESLYLRGTVSHVQGDLTAALGWYDRALNSTPSHVEALVSRAGLYLDLGRLADAERDVETLLKAAPKEPRAVYLKALLAERQGKAAESRSALNDVTALIDPVPVEFLRYRPQLLMLGGLAHFGLGQFEKAKPYLELVQRAQPNSAVSKLMAQIHLSDKNIDRAIESLDAYLRAFPGDTQAVMLLASAHMSQGRYARATQLTQDALKGRESADLRTMLGLSLVGGGKYGNALAELETAYKKDPRQTQAGIALVTIYLQSGQPAKAVKLADTLAKSQPSNPGILNLLGTARAASGDAAGARTAFEQAIARDPDFAAPQINVARLDAQAGAYDVAAARLNAVLARDAKNLDAMTALAAEAERRRQFAEAQRWLEKADDLAGLNNVQPGLALVELHLRNRNSEAAREALKRITSKAPEALPVLVASARVGLATGDIPGARVALTRAASLANYDAPMLTRLAVLQVQAGHIAGAAHSLGKALSERPDLLPAQALMTEVELLQGEGQKAEQRARQIVAAHPKAGVGHALLGDLALSRGQGGAAVEHYRRAHQIEQSSESLARLYRALVRVDAGAASQLAEQWVKTHPQDATVRRMVADGQARKGNLAAARASYEALLKNNPDDAEALNNLANVLVLLKDPTALQVADQALARKPEAPHIIGTAGWAAYHAGQTDRALQLLRDARLRDPSNPETRYFLGVVLAKAGRSGEAREEIQAALKAGPAFSSTKAAQDLLLTLK